jgi:hypothetical protein
MCVAVNSLAVLLHTVLTAWTLTKVKLLTGPSSKGTAPVQQARTYRHLLNKKLSQHMKAAVASS